MTSTPRSLLLPPSVAIALASSALLHAGEPPQYRLERLEVPGATSVSVNDVNDHGEAVGSYQDADFLRHAVYWDANGTAHTLALTPGIEVEGIARAINNEGQIVGTATDFEFGAAAALLWTTAAPGTYTVIHRVAEQAANVADINDAGVAVGGLGGFGTGVPNHAFSWSAADGLVDYGVIDPGVGNQNTRWTAIDNGGRLIGYWSVGFSTIHATTGQIGTPAVQPMSAMTEAFPSIAAGINNEGTVVGLGLSTAQPTLVPVVFTGTGEFVELPGATLAQTNGAATAINNAGVIVGNAGIGSANGIVPGLQAFVHVDGSSHDLFTLADDTTGYTRFSSAVAINTSGVIAGTGRLADSSIGSFLLVPIAADAIFTDGFEVN